MGSGKTTLIKILCAQLGVAAHVSSPTYSIVNEYIDIAGRVVYHFDFFRINTIAEAMDFGIEEYLSSGHVCLMEWPNIINPLLDGKVLKIVVTTASTGRNYSIEPA